MQLPDRLEIRPRGPIDASVELPGSKSYSNRAVLIAGLAEGTSQLTGVLESDDLRVMAQALRDLGASVTVDGPSMTIRGVNGRPSTPTNSIDVGPSGTAARLLTAAMVLAEGSVTLDGNARMRQRPIKDLSDALAMLGAQMSIDGTDGCPPVSSAGRKTLGGTITVDASHSSQYVSALLLISPYADKDTHICLKNGILVSRPYVEVTVQIMRDFGVDVHVRDDGSFYISAGQRYVARAYHVEPDASTATYFTAAAAITGGRCRIPGLPSTSLQADMRFFDLLERMGCKVTKNSDSMLVEGPDRLTGIDIDMNAMPDAVLAAAAVMMFADSPSHIRNVANLRIKETDRLAALETEIRRLGAKATTTQDSLTITPGDLRGVEVETYDDHRVAMSMALVGLKIPGVVIKDPACSSKSWPRYFEAFDKI